MRGVEEPPGTPETDPAGEAWVPWGALFLRLALHGGELLWLTNLPFLRWLKKGEPGTAASRPGLVPADPRGGWKA